MHWNYSLARTILFSVGAPRDVDERRSGMSEVSVQALSPQRVVSGLLRQLNQKQIEDAVTCFTTDFRYKDHGTGMEFRDKERLTEFFRKTRELYPDYFL
jgi:hypothetical protein